MVTGRPSNGAFPTTADPTTVTEIPVAMIAWLIRTDFTGARSIGKTVLLSTDLFAITEVTPLTRASAAMR